MSVVLSVAAAGLLAVADVVSPSWPLTLAAGLWLVAAIVERSRD